MDSKELQKFNEKKGLKTENGASDFITNLFRGIGNIFSSAIQMEKDGISEHFIISQVDGVTSRNKKFKMRYGIRTKIGLDNFINRNKSK